MEQKNDQLPQTVASRPINNKILWLMFLIAIFVYNVVAVLISLAPKDAGIRNFISSLMGSEGKPIIRGQDEFAGFAGLDGGTYFLLLCAFLIISVVDFVMILKLKQKAESKTPILGPSGSPINFGILRIAFAESMAIFGLVLFLLNGDLGHLIFFTFLAIIGMLLAYPKQ